MKYLQSDLYPELLKRNKIKIHIETGHIFFDNVNSNESIYSFFLAQQDHTKKLLNIVLETSVDYNDCISKYLLAIKYENEYDMLTQLHQKNTGVSPKDLLELENLGTAIDIIENNSRYNLQFNCLLRVM